MREGSPEGADHAHRGLAFFAVAAEAVSLVCSIVVVAVLHLGLGRDGPDYDGLHSQVNPWYGAAIWAMLAAVGALVLWGIVGLLRRPVGHRMAGWAVVGALLAFAGVAWALSYYKQLD